MLLLRIVCESVGSVRWKSEFENLRRPRFHRILEFKISKDTTTGLGGYYELLVSFKLVSFPSDPESQSKKTKGIRTIPPTDMTLPSKKKEVKINKYKRNMWCN
jgi:hypothetical protein